MKLPWPFGHLGLKAVSVGIALALWFGVSGEDTVERGVRVPLELQQFPAGLELQGEAPSLVDVRVRGASGTLSRLTAGDMVAVLDLRTAHAGRRLFQLTPESVRAPFGVQVVQVTPTTVPLAFEATATRVVPVVPALEGEPAAGFVTGAVTTEPTSVTVVGPTSAIERVTEVVTEPITVAGARETVSGLFTIGVLDPVLRLQSPQQARVRVAIVPRPVERLVQDRTVQVQHVGAGLRAALRTTTVDVVFRGSAEQLAQIDAALVEPVVDATGLSAGDHTLPVRLDGPVAARVARINPATVQVHITRGRD